MTGFGSLALRYSAWLSMLLAASGCTRAGTETDNPAEVDGGTVPKEDSGQGHPSGGTGPIGEQECLKDSDCLQDLVSLTEPGPALVLLGARCGHLDPSLDPFPVCSCRVQVTPADGGAPFESAFYPGHRYNMQQSGCSAFGRGPECLYCASEFPGCSLGADEECAEVCTDMFERAEASYQNALEYEVRLARCSEDWQCERIVEIGGRCYVGTILPANDGRDCALSDEELLALGPSNEAVCSVLPRVECQTADECPRGLACNGGLCGSCSTSCTSLPAYSEAGTELGECEGDVACASGELCAHGVCVPTAQVECRNSSQCPSGQDCVLSGLDLRSGRGNIDTRSFCQTDPRVGCSADEGWTPACIP